MSRRVVALVASFLVGAVLVVMAAVPGVASAAPPPTPPPNPSDGQLAAGHDAVTQRAAQVATLTAQLSTLDDQAAALQLELAGRQEQADRALVDQQNAQDAADRARADAATAAAATGGASAAVDALRQRVDEFVTARYQDGLDLGPLGLLTAPGGPQAVLDRAAFADLVAGQQQQALDALQRALVDKVNADSLARRAQQQAQRESAAARAANAVAAGAVATVAGQTRAEAVQLAQVQARHAEVDRELDAAVASDAGLRAQRARFVAWQAQERAAEQARALAAQRAAAAQVAAASRANPRGAPVRVAGAGAVAAVINRALSQIGVTYAWGGGDRNGPTRGVRDGGVADAYGDYRKIGFDCSGLMIYAFAGAGFSLPHYSGYQYTAGTQVPLADRRPGDMVFYSEGGAIGHVALYVGNGMMVEAPYSGASVRLVPLRFGGIMPMVARLV